MYFTFHGAECTFHGLESIFQGVEYTFQPMEHKTETSVKIIQTKCESKCLGEKMRKFQQPTSNRPFLLFWNNRTFKVVDDVSDFPFQVIICIFLFFKRL